MPDPRYGYTSINVKREVVPAVRRFQALAIGKRGQMMNVSEAIALALELATKELEK